MWYYIICGAILGAVISSVIIMLDMSKRVKLLEETKKVEKDKCCFCGKEIDKFTTNDARPIKVAGLDFAGCCDECNAKIVIPTRIAMRRGGQKIMCKKCGDIIQSKSVHDYVTCKCGAVAIDGGTDYTKLLAIKKIGNMYKQSILIVSL